MTNDEHQRERMRLWAAAVTIYRDSSLKFERADEYLAEFDKRFPAPVEQAPAEQADDAGFNYKDVASADVTVAELATLRDKARLWDALASGKLWLHETESGMWFAEYGDPYNPAVTDYYPTAAEAVEAAIAAGALK